MEDLTNKVIEQAIEKLETTPHRFLVTGNPPEIIVDLADQGQIDDFMDLIETYRERGITFHPKPIEETGVTELQVEFKCQPIESSIINEYVEKILQSFYSSAGIPEELFAKRNSCGSAVEMSTNRMLKIIESQKIKGDEK